jgi:hypothetical protein
MVQILCDMFIKQEGSYKRLLAIARHKYPNMKPLSTSTYILEGYPVLTLRFETNTDSQASAKIQRGH